MNVPFERQIWSAQQCADFLGISKGYFLRVTCHQAGFPLRLPAFKQPRWLAQHISDFATGAIKSCLTPTKQEISFNNQQ